MTHGVRSLAAYFAIAFGWTWGLWGIRSLPDLKNGVAGTMLMLASGFGPSLAAVLVVRIGGGRVGLQAWLARCLRWRLGLAWYALALGAPPLLMLAALMVHGVMGGDVPVSPASGHLQLAAAQFALVLVVGGPLGEEFGWRGYALPQLAAFWGWRWAGIATGAAWALWHLPLFFMAGTAQANLPMQFFLVSTVALSAIFARLSVNAGFSVLPAIVMHWSINAWSWALPVTDQAGGPFPYQFLVAVTIALAAIVLLKPGPRDGTSQPH